MHIVAIIPSLNDSKSLPSVISLLCKNGVSDIVVSYDMLNSEVLQDESIAITQGTKSGYDHTIQAGIDYVFEHIPHVTHILTCDAGQKFDLSCISDMEKAAVGGSTYIHAVRTSSGELHWHQKWGTRLIVHLMNAKYSISIHDLSPLRLIEARLLQQMVTYMHPRRFSYPVQLVKSAALCGALFAEVSTRMQQRVGKSKVSGSLKNSVIASWQLLWAM